MVNLTNESFQVPIQAIFIFSTHSTRLLTYYVYRVRMILLQLLFLTQPQLVHNCGRSTTFRLVDVEVYTFFAPRTKTVASAHQRCGICAQPISYIISWQPTVHYTRAERTRITYIYIYIGLDVSPAVVWLAVASASKSRNDMLVAHWPDVWKYRENKYLIENGVVLFE